MARTFLKGNIYMILIIHPHKRKASAISDMLHYMGILSYPATPNEAILEIGGSYRAVLIVEPEKMADAECLVERLRKENNGIPIFAISDETLRTALKDRFDSVFSNNECSSSVINEIVGYQSKHGLPTTAEYRLAGIDASCTNDSVVVYDNRIDFTKTETMILRYMIISYPTPQDAKSILRYAFKPLRKPEEASIRTHVSVMNKKFREARGKNLFSAIQGKGYVLATPETIALSKAQLLNA